MSQTTANSLGARRNIKASGASGSPSQGYKGVIFAQAESPICLHPHPPLQEFSLKVTDMNHHAKSHLSGRRKVKKYIKLEKKHFRV